jgi:LAO/AO transport system ATPase
MPDSSPILTMEKRVSLARLLSKAMRAEEGASRIGKPAAGNRPLVVAITGAGGVGKSTLIGRLLPCVRNDGKTVAVLACDPESPLTGGALLGDRMRLEDGKLDDGVFIRSLSTPSGQEAIARSLPAMLDILQSYGFDVVLIETVGAGQGDVAVHELADATVLLLQPQTGDDLQWEKAGILEVADVVVIHKADLPGADETEAQVRSVLGLGGSEAIPILRVSSKRGEGAGRLWMLLRDMPRRSGDRDMAAARLARLAHDKLERWLHQAQGDPAWVALLERNRTGQYSDSDAVREILLRAGQ